MLVYTICLWDIIKEYMLGYTIWLWDIVINNLIGHIFHHVWTCTIVVLIVVVCVYFFLGYGVYCWHKCWNKSHSHGWIQLNWVKVDVDVLFVSDICEMCEQ